MEIKLSKDTRVAILDTLTQEKSFIDFFGSGENVVNLLSAMFPLESMPSEDQRHKNALEDLSRHLILNDDWTAEYLFKDRLRFLEIENKDFVKFIELLVSPDHQVDVDAIHSLVTFFSSFLKAVDCKFVLSGYKNKLPVYKLGIESGAIKNIPIDVKENDIKFISRGIIPFSEKVGNHAKPDVFPSFVLAKNNWNDFHATTLHHLFFYPDRDTVTTIGAIKIMKKEELDTKIPENFTLLNESYCSLGMGDEFYQSLSDAVGDDFISVLFALRDAAFFPMIYEEFEDEEVFKNSLTRSDKIERSSRTMSYRFSGGNIDKRYEFEYKFKPLFSEEATNISFPFSSIGEVPRRMIAVIGKNGTGKTQLLTSLAKNLSDRSSSLFKPMTPAFGKILAVSYSVFDDFEIPNSDVSFNYKYCGLKKADGELLTESVEKGSGTIYPNRLMVSKKGT